MNPYLIWWQAGGRKNVTQRRELQSLPDGGTGVDDVALGGQVSLQGLVGAEIVRGLEVVHGLLGADRVVQQRTHRTVHHHGILGVATLA